MSEPVKTTPPSLTSHPDWKALRGIFSRFARYICGSYSLTILSVVSDFTHKIHSGEWLGFTGLPIHNVVNIGIGGSDLGLVMVYQRCSLSARKISTQCYPATAP